MVGPCGNTSASAFSHPTPTIRRAGIRWSWHRRCRQRRWTRQCRLLTRIARDRRELRKIAADRSDAGPTEVATQPEWPQIALLQVQDADDVRLQRSGTVKDAGGALLFSCLGRGQGLYGVANHDSDLFCKHLGPRPLGGFFANGEIGPVAGQTFLPGYTRVFGIFRPRPAG